MSLLLMCGTKVVAGAAPVEPFFSDDFASGNLTKTDNNAAWSSPTNCSVVSCDAIGLTRPPTNSANAVQFRYAGGAGSFAQLNLALDSVGAGYQEVFLRYYTYFPTGAEGGSVGPAWVTSTGSNGQKHLRAYDTPTNEARSWAFGCESHYPPLVASPTTATKHRMILYSGQPGAYNSPGQLTPDSVGYDIPAGQWLKVEWHLKANTIDATGKNVGGDGILRLYVNNVLEQETTTGSLCPAGGRMRGLYLFGNNNAAFDNANTRAYLSDFAVSATGRV